MPIEPVPIDALAESNQNLRFWGSKYLIARRNFVDCIDTEIMYLSRLRDNYARLEIVEGAD
jgi:hypothetical protein